MKSQYISAVYLFLVAVVSLILFADMTISQPVVLISFLLAIVVIGIPHGALDFHIAKNLKANPSIKWQLGFLALYLLVTLFSIGIWLIAPSFSLVVFLLISAYHFSSDWAAVLPKRVCLLLSSFVLFGPALLYQSAIVDIFGMLLVPQNQALIISTTMQFLALAALVGLLLQIHVLFANLKKQRWLTAEIAAMSISAILLSPLLHFVLYFCLLHSIKHWTVVSENLQLNFAQMSLISAPIVVATVIGGLIAWLVFPRDGLNTDIIQIVFIGLFGLTISHMVLIEKWQQSVATRS